MLGDEVYGNKDWNRRLMQSTGMARPLLHAHSLDFTHPHTGEHISLVAPLPPDVEAVVRRIYPQVSWSLRASLALPGLSACRAVPRVILPGQRRSMAFGGCPPLPRGTEARDP